MFCVVAEAVMAPLMVVVVPFVEPIAILVVDPETPAVPILMVLVSVFSVAPVPKFKVCVLVDWSNV